eukprot:scaffold18860_cov120-Isochrysis_galbana.AAC.3
MGSLRADARHGPVGIGQAADLHILGSLWQQNLSHGALIDNVEIHCCLVRLNLCDAVTCLHRVAHLDQILGDVALGHGGRERREAQHLVRRQGQASGQARRSGDRTAYGEAQHCDDE